MTATARLEIFHESAPHYVCSAVEGERADPLEAMREALRLEKLSGCEGWMIRDLRFAEPREYPAFLSKRVQS